MTDHLEQPNRLRLVLIGLIALLASCWNSPASADEESQTVSVTAQVSGQLVLALDVCDASADFGSGLNAFGQQPSDTTDAITVVRDVDQRAAMYVWTPSCDPEEHFLRFSSPLPMSATVCAEKNTGSSTLSVAAGDLRFAGVGSDYLSYPAVPFEAWNTFPLCSGEPAPLFVNFTFETFTLDLVYLLQIPFLSPNGDFNAITTYEITN